MKRHRYKAGLDGKYIGCKKRDGGEGEKGKWKRGKTGM